MPYYDTPESWFPKNSNSSILKQIISFLYSFFKKAIICINIKIEHNILITAQKYPWESELSGFIQFSNRHIVEISVVYFKEKRLGKPLKEEN